jgi:RNA polymerase sigma-70 factor (ECF subfamily)
MQIVTNIQADGARGVAVPTGLLDGTIEQVIAPVDSIVAAAQAGSSAAFEELHSIYSRRLYQTIFSITRNPHDAEEALQDTFLRAYRRTNTFEGKSKIYTWLTRIAVNSALMILRKRKVRSEVSFDAQSDDEGDPIAIEVKDSAPNPEEI